MQIKEIFVYIVGGYIISSLILHAYATSKLAVMHEESREGKHKLEALHRKVDELGWATKEGMRQAWRTNARHQLAEHTGMTAI